MRKKAINLLADRKDYAKLERYVRMLRWGSLIYSFLLLVFVGTLLYIHFKQTVKIQSLIEIKKQNINILSTKRDQEEKLIYAANKVKALDRFLLDDARFFPYYNLLVNSLNTATESSELSTLSIDKNRNFNFKLSFNNFDDLLNYFKYMESADFLKNFEKLILSDFQSSGISSSNRYELSFQGRFINLNNEN